VAQTAIPRSAATSNIHSRPRPCPESSRLKVEPAHSVRGSSLGGRGLGKDSNMPVEGTATMRLCATARCVGRTSNVHRANFHDLSSVLGTARGTFREATVFTVYSVPYRVLHTGHPSLQANEKHVSPCLRRLLRAVSRARPWNSILGTPNTLVILQLSAHSMSGHPCFAPAVKYSCHCISCHCQRFGGGLDVMAAIYLLIIFLTEIGSPFSRRAPRGQRCPLLA
jgi:hypothetical protein